VFENGDLYNADITMIPMAAVRQDLLENANGPLIAVCKPEFPL